MRADPVVVDSAAVDQVKAHLRIETGDEDDLIGRLVAAAIGHIEADLGLMLAARELTEWIGCAISYWQRLSRSPVAAITAIEAVDASGTATALPIDDYAIDIDAGGDGWVRILDASGATRLQARYTAGLATAWAGLPEPLAQGVIRLAAHGFTYRDAADAAPPSAVAAIWRSWRRFRL